MAPGLQEGDGIMRFVRPGLAGAMVLWGQVALAQDVPWQTFTDAWGRFAAGACPITEEGGGGNYFCLILACAEGGGAEIEVVYAGGAPAARPPVILASVEGYGRFRIEAEDRTDSESFRYVARAEAGQGPALIEALRRGSQASVGVEFGVGTVSHPLPLRGSSAALGAVLERCPLLPAAAAVPAAGGGQDGALRHVNPALRALDQATQDCAGLGGTIAVGEGLVRQGDLDGDGMNDVVLDWGALGCSAATTLYCGSGGCLTEVWRSEGVDYALILSEQAHAARIETMQVLVLDQHGSACGRVGAEPCRRAFLARGGQLVPVELD